MGPEPRAPTRAWGLAAFLLAAILGAVAAPVQGGTEAAPEVQDPAGDVAIADTLPACLPDTPGLTGCVIGSAVDLLAAWIDNETDTGFEVHVRVAGDLGGAQVTAGLPYGFDDYDASFRVGNVSYTAVASVAPGPVVLPGGIASAASANASLLTWTIPKAAVGSPPAGSTLFGLHLTAARNLAPGDPVPANTIASDEAPDEGAPAAGDYTFSGGAGPTHAAGDGDGDGLNDTCEVAAFSNVTAQDASGDPDGDGLGNGQECALGTDPSKADSDGDGCDDKADAAPLDATRGCPAGATPTAAAPTPTGQPAPSAPAGSPTPRPASQASPRGYLALSLAGFLAVLATCLVGLFVRWRL